MQENLKSTVSKLGVAEKDIIENNYLEKLQLWARLIDEVEAGMPFISDIPNSRQYFDQARSEFDRLIGDIARLNIAGNPSGVSDIQNYYRNFQQQYFERLLDQKQKIQAATDDKTDINSLRRLIRDAKKQQTEFEKSFKKNIEARTESSQRVLAAYFQKRLTQLKDDSVSSPEKWLKQRRKWFGWLLFTILLFAGSYIIIFCFGWLKGYEIQLTLVKAAIIALLYLQYHFATRNYHIYADLVAKYEHLAVVSETMTDFTSAAGFGDEELKRVVYANATKTLFSEIFTGHLKQQSSEPSVIENFINQIPKSSQ